MSKYTQNDTPLYDALREHMDNRVVHFDVPGHKAGRGNKELKRFLGEDTLRADVNSMKPLDNLCHPVSVIKEASDLAAQAFGADECFFIVNGTTAAVQTMIMSVCKENDKIIMPRNVHRSAINAIVINGAVPVYVNPGVNTRLGIPLGMSLSDVKKAIDENPDAKAVMVNNPTYYGVCTDLAGIVEYAHAHGMKVLVDEAHGTHFYFGENMPVSAMAAGADMAAVSMHKTGGSLTQSSLLLCKKTVNPDYVRQVLNLTQTTSGAYLLMSSLDISRKNLFLNGRDIFKKTSDFCAYARKEINELGGYYAFGDELINGEDVYAFDPTKLSIHTRDIGLAGIEVYDLLRDEYDIQIEFGDIGNVLAIISGGERELEIERLLSALTEIKRINGKDSAHMFNQEYIEPVVKMNPKNAFFTEKRRVKLTESEGEICGEFLMCYPPGIPILAPGELITKQIIEYVEYALKKGCLVTGPEDMTIENINVVEKR